VNCAPLRRICFLAAAISRRRIKFCGSAYKQPTAHAFAMTDASMLERIPPAATGSQNLDAEIAGLLAAGVAHQQAGRLQNAEGLLSQHSRGRA
jgi:hypothetical protein